MFWALLIGTALLAASLVSCGIATVLIVKMAARLIRDGYTGQILWKNVAIMAFVLLVTAAAHLIQIALWAIALLTIGEVPTFDTAFYLSAQNYTALGYGDLILSKQWRLLGPLESINGLLLFGLTTGILFAVLSRLMTDRLRLEVGHSGQATRNEEAKPDARRDEPK